MTDHSEPAPDPPAEDDVADADLPIISSSPPPPTPAESEAARQQVELIGRMLQEASLLGSNGVPGGGSASSGGGSKQITTDQKKRHAFWDTQPMLSTPLTLSVASPGQHPPGHSGPILPPAPGTYRPNPYAMPAGFVWSDVDITDLEQRMEVYQLLNKNYVEDDDCLFRFDYSADFLQWALTPPGFRTKYHVGVRCPPRDGKPGKGRLMAFISAIPASMSITSSDTKAVEINYLCIHKRLRSKRLAPVLIKEITRRVNLDGIYQAVYTAGVELPTPVGSCQYWHRSLDPKKLLEVDFLRLSPRMTLARTTRLYKLPTNPTALPGLRAMTVEDVPGAHKLLVKYLEQFKLHPEFSEEEFSHWLFPRPGVVSSYVSVDASGKVTDLCSYYHLPSTILGNAKHSVLRAAYSFYNVATSVTIQELMGDCLVMAKKEGQDVFNALDVMENKEFLQGLKFGVGDGHLKFYIYNWTCPRIESNDIGLVLL